MVNLIFINFKAIYYKKYAYYLGVKAHSSSVLFSDYFSFYPT